MGLDVNKENLIEQEIKDRLGRVEKVEMAKAIKVTNIIKSNHLQYLMGHKFLNNCVPSVPTASRTFETLNIWSRQASVL